MSTDNCESSNFLKRACNPAGDSGGGGGGGSTSPGGSNTQVQYNNAGSFGGSSDFTYKNGNVGIGTNNPTGLLHVRGGTAAFDSGVNISGDLRVSGNGYFAPDTIYIGEAPLSSDGKNLSGHGLVLSNRQEVLPDYNQGTGSFSDPVYNSITPSGYLTIQRVDENGLEFSAFASNDIIDDLTGSNITFYWGTADGTRVIEGMDLWQNQRLLPSGGYPYIVKKPGGSVPTQKINTWSLAVNIADKSQEIFFGLKFEDAGFSGYPFTVARTNVPVEQMEMVGANHSRSGMPYTPALYNSELDGVNARFSDSLTISGVPVSTGGGGPGGTNTQVQYNNAGSFGGSSDFTYDGDKVSIKTLLVTGEAYIEHAQDLYIGDPLITLNSGVTAPNTYDIGFIGDRGATDNIGFIWDESADTFAFIQTTDNGSTIGNVPIDSYKNIKANTGLFSYLDVDGGYSSPQMRIGYDELGNGIRFHAQGTFNHYNWLISQQSFTDQSLEFTPSATTGSQNFQTPVFAINRDGVNVTGNVKGTGAGDRITLGGTPYLLSGDVVGGGGGTAASGNNTNIQYNDGGNFAGSNDLTWDGSQLSVTGAFRLKEWQVYNYTDDSLRFNYNNSGNDELVLNSNGSLFITCPVDITPDASMTGQLRINGNGYSAGIHLDGTAAYFGHNSAVRRLEFQTDEKTRMTIAANTGAVGIGTTSPSYGLDVVGDAIFGFNSNDQHIRIHDQHGGSVYAGIGASSIDTSDKDLLFYSADGSERERMRIKASGNVGIGTTSPAEKLDVDGSIKAGHLKIEEGNFGGRIGFNRNPSNGAIYDNSFAAFQINGAAAGADYLDFQAYDSASTFGGSMVLHSSGNVGIGTTSPDFKLTVDNGIGNEGLKVIAGNNGDSNESVIEAWNWKVNGSDPDLLFKVRGDGNVGIGITNPSTPLDVNGTYSQPQMRVGFDTSGNGILFHAQGNHTQYNWLISQQSFTDTSLEFTPSATTGSQTFTTPVFGINKDGDVRVSGSLGVGLEPSGTVGSIVASNDVVAYASSDERLKDNVAPIPNALNKVTQINGVEFDWNENAYEHLAGHDVGVIAQNIESVLPEVVATRDDGYKAVRYEKIVPLLIEAIKDQQEQINELKAKIK